MRLVGKVGGAGVFAFLAATATLFACAQGTSTLIPDDEGGVGDGGTTGDRTLPPPGDSSGGTPDTGPEEDSGGSCTKKVVVNEVSTGSSASALAEFVELYNPNTCAVPLGNYRIGYRAANGNPGGATHTFAVGDSIAAKSFLVVGTTQFTGKKDATFNGGFTDTGGSVALLDDTDTIVDSVGWGNGTGMYVEKSTIGAAPAGGSIARKADGVDTDDNSKDFKVNTAHSAGAAN